MKISGVQPSEEKTIDRTGRGFLFGFFKWLVRVGRRGTSDGDEEGSGGTMTALSIFILAFVACIYVGIGYVIVRFWKAIRSDNTP